MGASPRHVHAQRPQLSGRHRAVFGLIGIAFTVPFLLAALPGGADDRSVPLIDEQTWLGIALDHEGRVPSKELLGAPVSSTELLVALREGEISVESFRVTGTRIRNNAVKIAFADEDPMANVFAELEGLPEMPLPPGVSMPRVERRPEPSHIAPELRCAKRLLESLAAPFVAEDRR